MNATRLHHAWRRRALLLGTCVLLPLAPTLTTKLRGEARAHGTPVALSGATQAQQPARGTRVVFIVLDGVRTEEFFQGAVLSGGGARALTRREKKICRRPKSSKCRVIMRSIQKKAARSRRNALRLRREQVLPFVWQELAAQPGTVVLGDRFENPAAACRVSNHFGISLPAYADLLSAARQTRVHENNFTNAASMIVAAAPGTVAADTGLEHPTIADRLLSTRMLRPEEVAVFASWERVAQVSTRATTPAFTIDAGRGPGDRAPRWGQARLDADTQSSLLRYLAAPERALRYLFVAYNDSDEWAHLGNYRAYVRAIQNQDSYIRQIYTTLEARPEYHGRTIYIITTDHGRGAGRHWPNHGRVPGSQYVWTVVHIPEALRARPEAAHLENVRGDCQHVTLADFAFRMLNVRENRR